MILKVTVCQIDPRAGQLDQYLSALTDHVHSERSDFLLLPEMSFSEWLAADPTPDPERWSKAVNDHARYIEKLGSLGARAVMGTRPITNTAGSRRNEAYLWTADTGSAAGVREKYYLPDEDGYWEHSWYDRGPKTFDTARWAEVRIGVQICTEMWFFEWARHYAAARADLLCVPRATPMIPLTNGWPGGRRRPYVPGPIASHQTSGARRAAKRTVGACPGLSIRKAISLQKRILIRRLRRQTSTFRWPGPVNRPIRGMCLNRGSRGGWGRSCPLFSSTLSQAVRARQCDAW